MIGGPAAEAWPVLAVYREEPDGPATALLDEPASGRLFLPEPFDESDLSLPVPFLVITHC